VRSIVFYRLPSGGCPVSEFLDQLDSKQAQKVGWVLQLIRELPRPPAQYLKKLVGTEIWEVRAEFGGNAFRLLGFLDGPQLIVLTSGFAKKTQRTPKNEISTAEKRRVDYLSRKHEHGRP